MSVSTAFDHLQADDQSTPKSEAISSRLWPTFLVVLLQATFVAIWLSPAVDSFPRFILMMAGPLLSAALFSGLLSFSSRLRWSTSLGVLFGCILIGVLCGVTAAPRSGMAAWFYGVPLAITLIWVGLAVSRLWPPRQKLLTMLGLSLLGWLGLASLRVDGMDGYYMPALSWRWSPTKEQRMLASFARTQPATSTSKEEETAWSATTVEWPGFRGPNRNARVTESLPKLDWTQNPPKELWRRPVGPGWSSTTIVSGRLFTQEQRGDDELVMCYDAATCEPIWQHSETSRFEEITSGAGPRATPTYADGKLFCFGAKAILVALNAATGELLWRHDLMEEVNASLPIWGFTSSPAVFGDLVVVFAGGSGDNGLMAFDCATGEVRWTIAGGGMNFGSAQPMTFDGTDMLVFVNTGAVLGANPADGQILWRHEDEVLSTPPIVQPQQIDANSLLLPFGDPGVAKLRITRLEEESGLVTWNAEEEWKSRNLKPWYNDFVIRDGHIFGFDKQIFACVDLADGKREWKRGRYGFGQALLLEASGQIIVTTEKGDVVLLDADTSKLTERGRFTAFQSKTWNHPVVVNGKLFLRCDSEMACYAL